MKDIYFKGDGFILRQWNMDDCTSLAEYANNIKVWNNVRDGFPHPYTEKDAEEYITMVMQKDRVEDMAIEVDGKAVGGLGFIPQSDVERLNAEVGYWIGGPYWGKGIVAKALKLFTCYIFSETEIIRLYAGVFDFNKPSMRVLEKAGFQKIGVQHKAIIKNGNIMDFHMYEKLKEGI